MRSLLTALLLAPLAMCGQTTAPAPAPAPATAPAQQPATENHGAINWMTIEEAQAAAKKDGKPLMIDVFTPWCGPCKMLANNTFTDAKLAAYVNEHFHAVKFNAEGPDPATFNGQTFTNPDYKPENAAGRNGTHQLTGYIAPVNGRIAYPTMVWLDKDGNMLSPIQGYLTPAQLEPILVYFGEGHYKTMEFQPFYESFKGTWGTP